MICCAIVGSNWLMRGKHISPPRSGQFLTQLLKLIMLRVSLHRCPKVANLDHPHPFTHRDIFKTKSGS
jgi:hypothetical protein